jgi:hypothetical protein
MRRERTITAHCLLLFRFSFSFINPNLNVYITCFYVRPDVPIKINPMHHRLVGIYSCVFINEGVFTFSQNLL